MRRTLLTFILALAVATLGTLLLHSCARMGTPDGGAFDETPPHITSTSPKENSINQKGKKITLTFNENIKLTNASEKVIVSPPQMEQPEIDASGRKITIELQDTIQPNTTYTIDFSDAIEDNNEGNPMGNYAFTFSTGEQVDTMQVSGYVLDASNLEPIKGILVGLYRETPSPTLPLYGEGGHPGDSILNSNNTDGNNTNGSNPDGSPNDQTTKRPVSQTTSLPDSIFRTKAFERISRTDSRGRFSVKGLARDAKYRAFALQDQDQDFKFSQRAEMIAFNHKVFTSSCKLDIRPDTVWHDSIHYDSIKLTPFTHFYPDDIALLAFTEDGQDQHLLKQERPILENFDLYFTARADTLPRITGINFCADSAFVIDASEHLDTLHYWIRDSLIYNIDTLIFALEYLSVDTAGLPAMRTDTLSLVSKLTKEKIAKDNKKAWEEWEKEYKQKYKEEQIAKAEKEEEENEENGEESEEDKDSDGVNESSNDKDKANKSKSKKKIKTKKKKDIKIDLDNLEIPPMPEEFMEMKTSNTSGMDPDKNVDITFNEPIDSFDVSKVLFYLKSDTLKTPLKHKLIRKPGKVKEFRLFAEWEPDSSYIVELDTGAFVNIYGKRSPAQNKTVSIKSLDTYSTLFVTLVGADSSTVVQLLDGSDKPVKTVRVKDSKADFYFVNPGTYYMRAFFDHNGDGIWTTGNYDAQLQPEEMFYNSKALNLRAKWDVNETWNLTALPLDKQKPLKITKQKPDKEKDIKSKNRQRMENKQK